ncbi:MAG: GRRM system radical SAM/SPASM domain protein, partial [Tardiphaga sp.]
MPFDIVESAVRFVFDNALAAPDFTIVWHSGEPLVLPVQWYREAFASASRGAPASLPHSMQTNGMLV